MPPTPHQDNSPAPDIAALVDDLRERARARIASGQYPASLDHDLDHHYRAIVASRNPGTPLHEQLLMAFDTGTATIRDPALVELRDSVRSALVLLADELPLGRGAMPERLDDLLDRVVALERALGAGPESLAVLLDRVAALEDMVAALQPSP